MKVLIAMDSYKGCLSADDAGQAVGRGFADAGHETIIIPMADGGEGTVSALVSATCGRMMESEVLDPIERHINAQWGISGDERTAFIEMSAASGLPLVGEQKSPLTTTTYGTGQLIMQALDCGVRKIILGIGGSATVDGGQGMLEALGVRFLDSDGIDLKRGGGFLGDLVTIDTSYLDERIPNTEFLIACDVDSPLCGSTGAAHLFAPQKGADKTMVELLERNLRHFAAVIKNQHGKDILSLPGAGAGGGIAAGAIAFLHAALKPGVEIVSSAVGLKDHIKNADLVITGEGNTDEQTIHGKVVAGVASLARPFNLPVICISGGLGEGYNTLYDYGITACISICDKPMMLKDAISNASELLYNTGYMLGRIYKAL